MKRATQQSLAAFTAALLLAPLAALHATDFVTAEKPQQDPAAVGRQPAAMTGTDRLMPDETETPRMKAWCDLNYGLFIHFNMNTFQTRPQPPATRYAPTELDVAQWARVAKQAGMRYAVLTAKHNVGFCLWDSKVQFHGKEYDYDVAASGNPTDVVRAFLDACKKYDLVPGLYYNLRDFQNHPLFLNKLRERHGRVPLAPDYFALVKAHLAELTTRYPECHYYWIDHSQAATAVELTAIYELLRKADPRNVVLFNTHLGQGQMNDAFAQKQGFGFPADVINTEGKLPRGPVAKLQSWQGRQYFVGYEHCDMVHKGWFYSGEPARSTEDLFRVYRTVRNAGGNLLLDVGPNQQGQIESQYVEALLKLKEKIEPFEQTLAKEQVALADAWYDLAEQSPPLYVEQLQARAMRWYNAAAGVATGLLKNKIDKRLRTLANSGRKGG